MINLVDSPESSRKARDDTLFIDSSPIGGTRKRETYRTTKRKFETLESPSVLFPSPGAILRESLNVNSQTSTGVVFEPCPSSDTDHFNENLSDSILFSPTGPSPSNAKKLDTTAQISYNMSVTLGSPTIIHNQPKKIVKRAKGDKIKEVAEKTKAAEGAKAAKAAKVAEERAIKAVNKLRTSKTDCANELIVELGDDFACRPCRVYLERLLDGYGTEIANAPSNHPHVITWKRRATSRYESKLGYFVPVPEEITQENQILIYMTAEVYVDLNLHASLQDYVETIKAQYANCKYLLLIEGLAGFLKRIEANRKSRYAAMARSAMSGSTVTLPVNEILYTEDDINIIEMAAFDLQLRYKWQLMHSASTADSAEKIMGITLNLALAPYRYEFAISLVYAN